MPTSSRRARPLKISETDEHRTISAYFRKIGLGGNALAFHIRNERPGDWQRLNATKMGVLSGLPDWLVIDNGRALFAEIKPRGWKEKKQRTGRYTNHELRQIEIHNKLRQAGASVVIVETLEEMLEALGARGVPLRDCDPVTEGLRKHLPAAMAAAEGAK